MLIPPKYALYRESPAPEEEFSLLGIYLSKVEAHHQSEALKDPTETIIMEEQLILHTSELPASHCNECSHLEKIKHNFFTCKHPSLSRSYPLKKSHMESGICLYYNYLRDQNI